MGSLNHFPHQHNQGCTCDLCQTWRSGIHYRCNACDFDLHDYCAILPRTISFVVHPWHNLHLLFFCLFVCCYVFMLLQYCCVYYILYIFFFCCWCIYALKQELIMFRFPLSVRSKHRNSKIFEHPAGGNYDF